MTHSIEPAGGDTATPLNLGKRLRLVERVAGSLRGLRVIDCGCGGGEYVRALRAAGAEAVGIEYQAAKLAAAAGPARDACSVASIERMPFGDATFQLALVNEVLEHVPDDLGGLREVARILEPGGVAVVFSPNRLHPFETHGVFWKDTARKVPHYVPAIPYLPVPLGRRWFRYWARNYWPWELRGLIERAGFELVDSGFVWQTFENISGAQPRWMRTASPLLRALSGCLERTPLLRSLGVSQMCLARRPAL